MLENEPSPSPPTVTAGLGETSPLRRKNGLCERLFPLRPACYSWDFGFGSDNSAHNFTARLKFGTVPNCKWAMTLARTSCLDTLIFFWTHFSRRIFRRIFRHIFRHVFGYLVLEFLRTLKKINRPLLLMERTS